MFLLSVFPQLNYTVNFFTMNEVDAGRSFVALVKYFSLFSWFEICSIQLKVLDDFLNTIVSADDRFRIATLVLFLFIFLRFLRGLGLFCWLRSLCRLRSLSRLSLFVFLLLIFFLLLFLLFVGLVAFSCSC